MTARPVVFALVGAGGFLVQLAVLTMLVDGAGWPLPLATLIAVQAAIAVNFVGHEQWTWRDRPEHGRKRATRFLRFQLGNGLTSLAGNVILTSGLAAMLRIDAWLANTIAVMLLAIFNFATADRWVFAQRTFLPLSMLMVSSSALAAGPSSQTLAAWERHAAEREQEFMAKDRAPFRHAPEGRMKEVPGGIVHEWRASIVVHATSVGKVVDTLLDPCSLPAQEDVAEVRLLERHADHLRVYMRLVRRMIVTATYDTEHAVDYTRHSPTLATSRSVATRIAETRGDDRGFLWRLNSYWRYRQVGTDVQIDMLSLSLSRGVPWALRPIAAPIIERVGRESVERTLGAVFAATDQGEERQRRQSPGCGGVEMSMAAATATGATLRPARNIRIAGMQEYRIGRAASAGLSPSP